MNRGILLRVVLAATGVFFIAGLYPASRIWPEGFGWSPPYPVPALLLLTLVLLVLRPAAAPSAKETQR